MARPLFSSESEGGGGVEPAPSVDPASAPTPEISSPAESAPPEATPAESTSPAGSNPEKVAFDYNGQRVELPWEQAELVLKYGVEQYQKAQTAPAETQAESPTADVEDPTDEEIPASVKGYLDSVKQEMQELKSTISAEKIQRKLENAIESSEYYQATKDDAFMTRDFKDRIYTFLLNNPSASEETAVKKVEGHVKELQSKIREGYVKDALQRDQAATQPAGGQAPGMAKPLGRREFLNGDVRKAALQRLQAQGLKG